MRLRILAASGLAFIALLFCSFRVSAQDEAIPQGFFDAADTSITSPDAALTEELIMKRLRLLPNNCVAPRVTGVVQGYIQTYVRYKGEKTAGMLGRRLTYFPLFEQKLKEHGLPSDLKYLAVVESALNPRAVSRVGATGLWQFMPATGKEYNLEQTGVLDERSDAVSATEAAARYLKSLYNIYEDWALALAAYNSGPSRVNAAIKQAHSRNFWQIQRYLPQETRNYVPAFIAATYICNYFSLHGIDADIPGFDKQLTTYVTVFDAITFNDIAKATGLDIELIRDLNAGYKRDYIPASEKGHYVLLPQRVMPAFIRYLNDLGSAKQYAMDENIRYIGNDYGDGKYAHFTVTVNQSDHIDHIAEKYGCNGEQLKTWNRLASSYVNAGQKLKIWRPIRVLKHENARIEVQAETKKPAAAPAKPAAKPAGSPAAAPVKPAAAQTPAPQPAPEPQPIWHTVQRTETLSDIARNYNVPEQEIRTLNKFTTLKPGMRIKIKN